MNRITAFAARLGFVMKALGWSRGRLATALAVDKSVVSRWLSGSSTPGDHNLSRLTMLVGERISGFTMLDWELDEAALALRFGVAPPAPAPPRLSLPDLASLPSMAASRLETPGRARRYGGLWRLIRPMMARPDGFVCEHLALARDGDWLKGRVHNMIAELPAVGLIADGQLFLLVSVQNSLATLLFNRVDDPIVDQVDGLILAPAVATVQTPSASRVVLQRLADADASAAQIAEELAARAAERRILSAAELDAGLAAALLPDAGPVAHAGGGDRLLRAANGQSLIRSRWS